MSDHLRPLTGSAAEMIAERWRAKQLEYTFRRAAMGTYENFDICTEQALRFVLANQKIELPDGERELLLEHYKNLDPYPDAARGLRRLKESGYSVAAFSNGVEATLRKLLARAGLIESFDTIVSVDDLKTFKPDPRVYRYLAERLGFALSETWLFSSNAFDVIGAKSAGLRAAWVRRDPALTFDPWPAVPDLIASDLEDLARQLG